MLLKQRGEGAHLLGALWFRLCGDVINLRRLHLYCRTIGQTIAEHEISEMLQDLEESQKKETCIFYDRRRTLRVMYGRNQFIRTKLIMLI
jgi:hypothetical protein